MRHRERFQIYCNGFERKLKEMEQKRTAGEGIPYTLVKGAAYYGVMSVVTSEIRPRTEAEAKNCFQHADNVLKTIAILSPDQLQGVFPIWKWYRGAKIGLVDYFSTMERIRALPGGRPIFESVEPMEFLMDYDNMYIQQFLLKRSGYMRSWEWYRSGKRRNSGPKGKRRTLH